MVPSFFRVYKCQIIMVLEASPTDFMGFPAPSNSDLPVKDDRMQYLKTIQKSVFFWWRGRITGWM